MSRDTYFSLCPKCRGEEAGEVPVPGWFVAQKRPRGGSQGQRDGVGMQVLRSPTSTSMGGWSETTAIASVQAEVPERVRKTGVEGMALGRGEELVDAPSFREGVVQAPVEWSMSSVAASLMQS